jgi:hypothetical protein
MAISKRIHTAVPANPIGNPGVQLVSGQWALDQITSQIPHQAVRIGLGEQRMSEVIQCSVPRCRQGRATPTPVLQHSNGAPGIQRDAHEGRKTHDETR